MVPGCLRAHMIRDGCSLADWYVLYCAIRKSANRPVQQYVFGALLVYTWSTSMFVDATAYLGNDRNTALYALTVAPAIVFALSHVDAFLRGSYDRGAFAIATFAAIVSAIAVLRGDFPTVVSMVALSAALIVFRHSRPTAPLALINALFFASMVCTGLLHAGLATRYGIIPGQSEDVAWRVSLFPYNITPSWLFALVVLFANYFRNPNPPFRWIMIALSLYFITLSASRTALIVLAVVIGFIWMTRLWEFRDRLLYRALLPVVILVLVLFLTADTVLTVLVGVDNPVLNSVLFRSEAGAADVEQATTSIYRTIIWGAHIGAFLGSPLIGVGTFEFGDLMPEHSLVTGSEAFITGLLARVGMPALLFLYFAFRLAADAARERDRLAFSLVALFTISMLSYGSYIVPYNFNFLVLFGAMNLAAARHLKPAADEKSLPLLLSPDPPPAPPATDR